MRAKGCAVKSICAVYYGCSTLIVCDFVCKRNHIMTSVSPVNGESDVLMIDIAERACREKFKVKT
jgi:hypothetical protein